MNDDAIENVIREYVTKTIHMSIATVSENKPWVCEVHFVADDDLNLYFVSKKSTRHCQEIANNPNVAGNIVRQHGLKEVPGGIYFEGSAEAIVATEEDIERYSEGLAREPSMVKGIITDQEKPASMYKVIVKNWAAFGNFDGGGVVKHELNWSGVSK